VDQDERREFLRVLARIPMSCMAVGEDGRARLVRLRSVDLSAGGVSVLAEQQLELGQKMRLSFQAGDPPEALRLDARVVRVDPRPDGLTRYGLEFAALAPIFEQRLVRAVWAHERANANRHERVRMSMWHPVRCRLSRFREIGAHATSLSTDDMCIVSSHKFSVGDRLRVALDDPDIGVRIDAPATVSEVEPDGRGNLACTLLLDGLDRVARSAVLRNLMEAERRDLAEG
jgi:PilZ domain